MPPFQYYKTLHLEVFQIQDTRKCILSQGIRKSTTNGKHRGRKSNRASPMYKNLYKCIASSSAFPATFLIIEEGEGACASSADPCWEDQEDQEASFLGSLKEGPFESLEEEGPDWNPEEVPLPLVEVAPSFPEEDQEETLEVEGLPFAGVPFEVLQAPSEGGTYVEEAHSYFEVALPFDVEVLPLAVDLAEVGLPLGEGHREGVPPYDVVEVVADWQVGHQVPGHWWQVDHLFDQEVLAWSRVATARESNK